MKTVGIPRALLYHRYGRFWQTYLSELGLEVKVSRPTTKQTVERGVGKVSSEVCLPLKVMAGHIEELKDSVDYLFLPRLVWMQDELYACPKMIGVPDLAKLTVPGTCKLVAPTIKGDFVMPHFWAGLRLTGNPVTTVRAYRRARGELRVEKALPDFPADATRVALISHFYNLGDDYIAGDILGTFRSAGLRVYTKEDLPTSVLSRRNGLASSIRWVYERELYNAFRFYADKVDGICAVISFGCGPDSLIVDLMQREARERSLPFTQLVIDEHTGKAGIVTRLEAFSSLLYRKRQKPI
jgi:predicted nucleotide-binding protein (sugar kinase/HSP70/actin superfamily)